MVSSSQYSVVCSPCFAPCHLSSGNYSLSIKYLLNIDADKNTLMVREMRLTKHWTWGVLAGLVAMMAGTAWAADYLETPFASS